ncbi:hypothetical protein [Nocardia sp. NPDC052112]|uniref:hypothetical protein n=1 Tax=Nocardia sp. NPDC052112 TaxID=3155646 RepID=UPI003430150B
MTDYWQYDPGKAEPRQLDSPPKSGYYYATESSWGSVEKVTLYAPDGKPVESKGGLDELKYIADSNGKKYEVKVDDGILWGLGSDRYNLNPDKPLNEKPLGWKDDGSTDTLPATKDRREDRVLPGEKLAPEGSKSVTEGTARDSISNGDYTVKLNSDNELILTDKDGNQLWGYSGADAADLFSSNYEIKVDPDGSIKLIDPKTHEVVRTLREAGDPKHANLVLLYHPPAESVKLRIAIDEAQSALQLQVDCFAKGKAALAEDVGDWLHNQGLTDKDNKSSLTTSYNEDYLNYDTHVKNHFKDLDQKIRSIALDTNKVNDEALGKIMDQVNVLDDRLRDVTEKDTEEVPTKGQQTYKRILPDVEMPLFGLIDKAVEAVDGIIDNAKQTNDDNGKKTGEESPEYKAGKDDGYKAGYNAGLAAGGKDGGGDDSDTTPTDTTTVPTDWTDSYDDLLTSGKEGSTDGASDSTTEDTTTGTSGDNSSILATIKSEIDKIKNGSTKSSGNGSNNGSSANNGAGNSSNNNSGNNAMQQYMMMQALSSMFNKDKQPQESDRDRAEKEAAERRAAESQQTAQASATNPATMTDSGVVSATPGTPPQLSTNGNAQVDMRLPDGSTQKVASSVAQAVNKELNNPNGSDARAAYSGTGADMSRATPVATSDLHTGDVAQWTDRNGNVVATGLVVVDGAGLHLISSGHLVAIDSANPLYGGHDDYKFSGFVRPADGSAAVAASQATPAAPGAVTAPPSAPAAPPTVSAPAATI